MTDVQKKPQRTMPTKYSGKVGYKLTAAEMEVINKFLRDLNSTVGTTPGHQYITLDVVAKQALLMTIKQAYDQAQRVAESMKTNPAPQSTEEKVATDGTQSSNSVEGGKDVAYNTEVGNNAGDSAETRISETLNSTALSNQENSPVEQTGSI